MYVPADTAKVPTEAPEDSPVLRVRCLWFLTSDCFETWLTPTRTKRVNHGLMQLAPTPPLLVLCPVISNKMRMTKAQ